jgi:hypothetical protein
MSADADRFVPDPRYQRRIGLLAAMLDDGQVEVLLGQLRDRWAQPVDGEESVPQVQLLVKLTLEGLLHSPASAITDIHRLLDICFGDGPVPAP